MANKICPECGCPYDITLKECPECACPNDEAQAVIDETPCPVEEQEPACTNQTTEAEELPTHDSVAEQDSNVVEQDIATEQAESVVEQPQAEEVEEETPSTENDEDTYTCPECGCVYSVQLIECPDCGCPNDVLNAEKKAELEQQNNEELAVLEEEKNKIAEIQIQQAIERDKKDPALSLVRSLKRVFVRCDNFSGRSRRSEFWTFITFNCLVGFLLYMTLFGCIGRDYITVSDAPNDTEYWRRLISCCLSNHLIISIIIMVYLLLISLPLLSVTIRRLHDTNRSGLWIFTAIIPFALGLIYGFSPFFGVLFLSIMLLLDSVADNKWGRKYAY